MGMAKHRPIRDRRVYAAFFYVTAIFYAVIAVGTATSSEHNHLWPGQGWWVVFYTIAAFTSFIAGVTAIKSVRGPRLWVRRTGLLLIPTLLVTRGAANFAARGFHDGLIGSAFLFWGAFVILWAGYLLRHMPTSASEWEAMRHEVLEIQHQIER